MSTTARIRALRVEAGEHGDAEMVAICSRALNEFDVCGHRAYVTAAFTRALNMSVEQARTECERVLSEAQ
jgi:hypothetical protein